MSNLRLTLFIILVYLVGVAVGIPLGMQYF